MGGGVSLFLKLDGDWTGGTERFGDEVDKKGALG